MPDPYVNAQVVDCINQVQKAVMDPRVVTTSGAGKAYQSVAQSAAIAVQDATDMLRNMSTVSMTAQSVAMAQLLATQDPMYTQAITQAQQMLTQATTSFSEIGTAAATVLKAFPSG